METEIFRKLFPPPSMLPEMRDYYLFLPVDEVFVVMQKIYNIDLETLGRILVSSNIKKNLIARKSGYSLPNGGNLGMLTMESGEIFSFDPRTFELDDLEVLDAYDEDTIRGFSQKVITYIILTGFPLTKEQEETLKKEARKANESTRGLRSLNQDALEVVLRNTDPKDIQSLCQTNPEFRKLCNNPNVFKRLLDRYYPNLHYTNDPRKQFYAAVSGVRTYYRMEMTDRIINGDFVWYVFGPPEQMATSKIRNIKGWSVRNMSTRDILKVQRESKLPDLDFFQKLESDESLPFQIVETGLPERFRDKLPTGAYLIFSIEGLPSTGEFYWILLEQGSHIEYEVSLFKTREALADAYASRLPFELADLIEMFIDQYPGIHPQLDEYMDAFYGKNTAKEEVKIKAINITEPAKDTELLKRFRAFLEEIDVPMPFNMQHHKELAMQNKNLYLTPDTTDHQYQVLHVQF